jgi:D-alanyl-D-alanine carboxypeptidase
MAGANSSFFGVQILLQTRGRSHPSTQRWTAILTALLLCNLVSGLQSSSAQEVADLQINSTAYIVIDADTGEIFAQKNAHDQRPMASLTKVFTAIEALNRAPLDHVISTHESDLVSDDATQVGFGAGEDFTLQDLLYGMLLPSGNDAANAIARDLGSETGDTSDDESYQRFIDWMNARIELMGLVDTHLVNSNGWGVPGHHSSAYDLATFMRYAIQFSTFVDAIGTSEYETSNGYYFTNTNKILGSEPDLIGGKTGYDDDAGYCLIEVAQRDDHTMISVTLDGVAPDDWYDDNVVLLNYAFDQVEARGGVIEGEIASYTDPDLAMLSSASSGGAVQGVASAPESVSLQPTPAGSHASNVIGNQAASSDQSQSSETVSPAAPGLGGRLAIAFVVALAFAILAGRGLWKAEVGFAAIAGPRLKSIRFPAIAQLVERTKTATRAKIGSKEPSNSD